MGGAKQLEVKIGGVAMASYTHIYLHTFTYEVCERCTRIDSCTQWLINQAIYLDLDIIIRYTDRTRKVTRKKHKWNSRHVLLMCGQGKKGRATWDKLMAVWRIRQFLQWRHAAGHQLPQVAIGELYVYIYEHLTSNSVLPMWEPPS